MTIQYIFFLLRICIKIKFSSQWRDRLLFLPANMTVMMSHSNQLCRSYILKELNGCVDSETDCFKVKIQGGIRKQKKKQKANNCDLHMVSSK